MDYIPKHITQYMEQLASGDDEPVLLEMEALAREKNFPIIGRLCGQVLEIMARSIGARRIFEMGSGYGYSAYWFSRAVGGAGEIHLTDGDPENERSAKDFLSRAGLMGPVTYHVGDALESFASVEGEFDIVYCDIDKDGYPDAWRAARDRVRVGGFFICDNVLWSGRVAQPEVDDPLTTAIRELNVLIADDDDYRSTIVPTRDGVVIALRVR